jgi:hypothetical protein
MKKVDFQKLILFESEDYLVINNFLFTKTDQPEWMEKDNWKTEFIVF